MFTKMERAIIGQSGKALFLVLACLFFQSIHAAPRVLSEFELDRVSAGYVDLELSGRAVAVGPNSVSRFSATVEQTIGEVQSDNYIYTTTYGLAEAFAKGRRVQTEVGYFFQTDEEVLAFEVIHKFSSRSGAGKHKKKNKKNKQQKRKKKQAVKKSSNKNKKKKRKNNQSVKQKNKKKRKRVTREKQQLYVSVVTRRLAD